MFGVEIPSNQKSWAQAYKKILKFLAFYRTSQWNIWNIYSAEIFIEKYFNARSLEKFRILTKILLILLFRRVLYRLDDQHLLIRLKK